MPFVRLALGRTEEVTEQYSRRSGKRIVRFTREAVEKVIDFALH